jgi:effector-binding domain-containing protein
VELLPIGRFAQMSGLTVRAVRHYGELGLLGPAYVDPESGYRYYDRDQLAAAAAIRRLRFLEFALDDIRQILAADDPEYTRARLYEQRAKMAALAATTEQMLASLQRLIEGEEELVSMPVDIWHEVEVKDVPDQRVLVIRERARQEALSDVIPAAIREVHLHMKALGATFAGPPFIVCPYADEEGFVDLEIGWPVSDELSGGGRIESSVLPGSTMLTYVHRGHYQELDRSYRALMTVIERGELTVTGAPREIYATDPEEAPPEDWLTEIQFPIECDEARVAALR